MGVHSTAASLETVSSPGERESGSRFMLPRMSRGSAGFEEYTDPRLVALYDSWDPDRGDIAFYADLAAQIPAQSVADVGCGTGMLAVELARRGQYRVTGIDPSEAMLDFARARPGADRVRWIQGDAASLEEQQFDLVIMSGNVVQVIQDDRVLLDTFAAIRRALRPGGRLAFDSRNPAARAWTTWTLEATRRALAGGAEVWIQDTVADGDCVSFTLHYRFSDGQELLSRNELRFRSYAWLTRALTDSGFEIDAPGYDDADFIFLATPARPRRALAMQLHGNPPHDWWANVLYESADSVVVCLDDMEPIDILEEMKRLGVPVDLVAEAMDRFDVDWDPHADIRARSEADMDDWRRLDQERRRQMKEEFRRRRTNEDQRATGPRKIE